MIPSAALLDCTIPGQPIGKGRPLFARRGAGVVTRTPDRTAAWEHLAAEYLRAAWRQAPIARDVPVVVEVVALFDRPQRLRGTKRRPADPERLPHVGKPDADNVSKIALDALVLAGVLEDDACVSDAHTRKRYTGAGELPGVRVTVRRWMPDAATGTPL